MKYNAFILIEQNNHFLCVERKDGTFGLIGGKSEKNESPLATACREFEEESALLEEDLILYEITNPYLEEVKGIDTYCYFAKLPPHNLNHSWINCEGKLVKWCLKEELLKSYPIYNENLLNYYEQNIKPYEKYSIARMDGNS